MLKLHLTHSFQWKNKYRNQVESKISGIHPTRIIFKVRDLPVYEGHTLSLI